MALGEFESSSFTGHRRTCPDTVLEPKA